MPILGIDLEIGDADPQEIGRNAVQSTESTGVSLRCFKHMLLIPILEDEAETVAIRDYANPLHAASTNQLSQDLRIDGIHHSRNCYSRRNDNDYLQGFGWSRSPEALASPPDCGSGTSCSQGRATQLRFEKSQLTVKAIIMPNNIGFGTN